MASYTINALPFVQNRVANGWGGDFKPEPGNLNPTPSPFGVLQTGPKVKVAILNAD